MYSRKKTVAKLNALSDALDDLEGKLEPLLSRPLSETLDDLDTIQKAKLQVVLPYLLNDLIFIYLKTRGIDPKTHPVVGELDRVREYFEKIRNAEDPEKRKTEIDKAAATRFIKSAISSVQNQQQNPAVGSSASTSRSQPAPVLPTSAMSEKAAQKIREREQQQQDQRDNPDSGGEAEELVIFSGTDEKEKAARAPPSPEQKQRSPKRNRRLVRDPFTGEVIGRNLNFESRWQSRE